MIRRTLVLSLATALLGAAAARAQDMPEDKVAIWTLQEENSAVSTETLKDRFYVNGVHLGYVSGTDGVPDFLQGVGRALWPRGGQMRFAASLTQQMFTPRRHLRAGVAARRSALCRHALRQFRAVSRRAGQPQHDRPDARRGRAVVGRASRCRRGSTT